MSKKLTAFDPGPSGRFAAKILQRTNIPGAVIGRIAIWYWVPDPSEHKHTKDLDLAIKQVDMTWIRQALKDVSISTRELSIGGINAREDDVNVDFIDRSSHEYGDLSSLFSEAIHAAYTKGATVEIGGATLFVAPSEYVAVMKLATGEPEDEDDAGCLLSLASGIDISHVRKLTAKYLGPAGMGRLEALLRKEGHPLALPKRRY